MANAFEAKLQDFQARLYAKTGTDVLLSLTSKEGSGLDKEKYYDWIDDVEEGLFGDEAGLCDALRKSMPLKNAFKKLKQINFHAVPDAHVVPGTGNPGYMLQYNATTGIMDVKYKISAAGVTRDGWGSKFTQVVAPTSVAAAPAKAPAAAPAPAAPKPPAQSVQLAALPNMSPAEKTQFLTAKIATAAQKVSQLTKLTTAAAGTNLPVSLDALSFSNATGLLSKPTSDVVLFLDGVLPNFANEVINAVLVMLNDPMGKDIFIGQAGKIVFRYQEAVKSARPTFSLPMESFVIAFGFDMIKSANEGKLSYHGLTAEVFNAFSVLDFMVTNSIAVEFKSVQQELNAMFGREVPLEVDYETFGQTDFYKALTPPEKSDLIVNMYTTIPRAFFFGPDGIGALAAGAAIVQKIRLSYDHFFGNEPICNFSGGTFFVQVNVKATAYPGLGAKFASLVPSGNSSFVASIQSTLMDAKREFGTVASLLKIWIGGPKNIAVEANWDQLAGLNIPGVNITDVLRKVGTLPKRFLFPAVKAHEDLKDALKNYSKIILDVDVLNRIPYDASDAYGPGPYTVELLPGPAMRVHMNLDPPTGKNAARAILKALLPQRYERAIQREKEADESSDDDYDYSSSSSSASYSSGTSGGGGGGLSSATASCSYCNGSKMMKCAHCGGGGVFKSNGNLCNPCKGKGSKPCHHCK